MSKLDLGQVTEQPHRLPKVYVASKVAQASMWRKLREEWSPSIAINSRWIDHIDNAGKPLRFDSNVFWREDFEDISDATYLICYGTAGEHLRGALVETGFALALGRTVCVIGDHPDYGTWQDAGDVIKVATLQEAFEYINDNWDAF